MRLRLPFFDIIFCDLHNTGNNSRWTVGIPAFQDGIPSVIAFLPGEAEDYYDHMMKAEAEAEEYQDRLADTVIAHVAKMKKEDLRQWLLQLLFEGPEWQYERFVRESIDEYWDI